MFNKVFPYFTKWPSRISKIVILHIACYCSKVHFSSQIQCFGIISNLLCDIANYTKLFRLTKRHYFIKHVKLRIDMSDSSVKNEEGWKYNENNGP